jgi:hypothetical protein
VLLGEDDLSGTLMMNLYNIIWEYVVWLVVASTQKALDKSFCYEVCGAFFWRFVGCLRL